MRKVVFAMRYPKKLRAHGIGRLDAAEAERQFLGHVDALDVILGRRGWLAGDTLSIADISVAAQLDEVIRTSPVGAGILARANVKAWLGRMGAVNARGGGAP